jgi:hypothetical protein
MEEPSTDLLRKLGQAAKAMVDEALEEHIGELHIPPPRRGRVQAIPFPNVRLSDVQVSRALELFATGGTMEEAALAVGAPIPALERALAEYRPAWRSFLQEREAGA